jgi:hypothetical protein
MCGFPSHRCRIAQGHPSGSQIILAFPPTSRLPTRSLLCARRPPRTRRCWSGGSMKW